MPVFLRQVQEVGFTGVQNFPTVGLIDGIFRQNLEETGMSYALEVEMIRAARELGLLDLPVRLHARRTPARWRRRAPTCSSRTWA